MFYNGQWANVCNDKWDSKDGNVVCHQLGYPNVWEVTRFEHGTGAVALDEVHCDGTESALSECQVNWGVHDCGTVAGVVCGDLGK